jgi:hypothetical protein
MNIPKNHSPTRCRYFTISYNLGWFDCKHQISLKSVEGTGFSYIHVLHLRKKLRVISSVAWLGWGVRSGCNMAGFTFACYYFRNSKYNTQSHICWLLNLNAKVNSEFPCINSQSTKISPKETNAVRTGVAK